MTRASRERLGGGAIGLLMVAGTLAGVARAQDTAAPPDFTGVWTTYREPGQPRFGGSQGDLPLTPEASARIDAYRALVESG